MSRKSTARGFQHLNFKTRHCHAGLRLGFCRYLCSDAASWYHGPIFLIEQQGSGIQPSDLGRIAYSDHGALRRLLRLLHVVFRRATG